MKRYKQKLREVWLQMPEFRPWLRRDPEDSYRARCRMCKCGVNTKICDLRAHAMTKKHMKRSNAVEIKRNDSSNDEDEMSFDRSPDYKPKASTSKRVNKNNSYESRTKSNPIKTETRGNSGPDYEAIIESLALYEPEQALFSNESTTQSSHPIDKELNGTNNNIDEEMITNAVTVAVKNMKDSAQIFGDFVADRLRQLTEQTSEYAKDKIMQVILEAAALDRTHVKCSEES
ncbi:uncharacterized protein LOC133838409 [Drosophila sulfurigaster albostrigata]|uniref:uncharacterized protein LOC133838409 n=1 Tax=Drosophila sulfurigaster albostrigata TaxID=89887 RepID=UPI002D21837A|nr:uncharacterized protein LOC133838409 [Drosophila sulfurigaster albostrigata]